MTDKQLSSSQLRLGGVTGIAAGLFLPGVALQTAGSGWFPEEALQTMTMSAWVSQVAEHSGTALLGVGFSIAAILMFFPFGLTLYRILPKDDWRPAAAFAGNLLGSALALAAFSLGFGFTWALTEMVNSGPAGDPQQLSAVAAVAMRGFLFSDDIATFMIGGIGHGLFATAALRTKLLPRWLCWWGIIAGLLVTVVLLRYFFSVFGIAAIGYPMTILWFVLTGIYLLGMAKQAA